MSVCSFVLALLMLEVGLAKCFSWDIVVSDKKRLKFYNNGTLTHTEHIPSANEIYATTYDTFHHRVLFADEQNETHQISSFDLSTRNIQTLVNGTGYYLCIAYDPATQLLFWLNAYGSIYSFSLNPASSNKAVGGNLVVKPVYYCYDIAVDSCGGYIYWITLFEIERIRFDGSEREVLIKSTVDGRLSLAIDQQTQKMYWIERIKKDDYQLVIKSADFNGKNRRKLYIVKNETDADSLTVSNDFIYWHGQNQLAIFHLPKNNSRHLKPKIISRTDKFHAYFQVIGVNYTINEQLKGNRNCETLKSLLLNESEPDFIDEILCVNGTKISGESRCKCTQGYTGERCDVSVCQNYCLEGNCSVSAEGQPKCRCKAGYFGERCEVNACRDYCLNSGVCSLNEDHDPVCQCTAGYDGERCAVPAIGIKCIQTVSMLKDMLNADIPPVTLSKKVQSTCASTVV